MKRTRSSSLKWKTGLLGFSVLTLFSCSSLAGAEGDAVAAADEKKETKEEEKREIPEAVFVDDHTNGGVDPFFPKSTRRLPEPPPPKEDPKPVVQETPKKEEPPPPPPDPYMDLTLKGVLGGRRPIATISTTLKNYQMEVNEERVVRLPDHEGGVQQMILKVIKIEDQAVIVKLGETNEQRRLKLPVRSSF